jgi:tRNA A22 N-methylase
MLIVSDFISLNDRSSNVYYTTIKLFCIEMGCGDSIIKLIDTNDNSIKNKNLQPNMNSCEFKEIVVVEDFEAKNGVLGLDRDIYLNIVKFLDSSIVRKVSKYFIFLFY